MTIPRSALSAAAGIVLAVVIAACSASTAHIGSLKLGKDKDVSAETNSFGLHDTIYAKGDASNLPNKVTMQWQVVAENAKGVKPNFVIPTLDKSYDLDSDGTVDYNLTPPESGWPAGTYKIVLTMMDNGQQRDQKSQEFTVSGS